MGPAALLLLLLAPGAWAQYTVSQTPAQATAQEGEPVQLNCSYTGTEYSVHWYRQPPGGSPQLVALLSSSGRDARDRVTMSLDTKAKSSDLFVNRSRLEDSGVYLCAVTNYNKPVFGDGTKLVVEPKLDNSPPSIYPLTSDNKNLLACLVTDFFPGNISVGSRPNANLTSLNASLVVMKGSGEASYGTVLWGPRDELACTADHDNQNFQLTDFDEEDDTCMIVEMDENFETDKNLNFLSLTLLGLRIVFVKTVAINLLLTLSQWKR